MCSSCTAALLVDRPGSDELAHVARVAQVLVQQSARPTKEGDKSVHSHRVLALHRLEEALRRSGREVWCLRKVEPVASTKK